MADLTIKRNDLGPITRIASDAVGPVDLDGATAELRRRGEELRSFTQLIAELQYRSKQYRVKSPLSGNNK